jgi:hypothetical protein
MIYNEKYRQPGLAARGDFYNFPAYLDGPAAFVTIRRPHSTIVLSHNTLVLYHPDLEAAYFRPTM